MSLNLQQRFLLFFSDYRTLRDENTHLGDEIVMLRGQLEEERRRYDELTGRYLERQDHLADKVLELSATPRVVSIRRDENASSAPTQVNAKAWQESKKKEFLKKLEKRQQQLQNPPSVN